VAAREGVTVLGAEQLLVGAVRDFEQGQGPAEVTDALQRLGARSRRSGRQWMAGGQMLPGEVESRRGGRDRLTSRPAESLERRRLGEHVDELLSLFGKRDRAQIGDGECVG